MTGAAVTEVVTEVDMEEEVMEEKWVLARLKQSLEHRFHKMVNNSIEKEDESTKDAVITAITGNRIGEARSVDRFP